MSVSQVCAAAGIIAAILFLGTGDDTTRWFAIGATVLMIVAKLVELFTSDR